MYSLGQDDPDTFYPKRVPFANSPFEKEKEDSVVDGSESDTNRDSEIEESYESPLRSVVGPDGLRNLILPPLWTVNDFNSTIKRKHVDTLRERYQIPADVPIRLPFKFEKCYYHGADNVRVCKQMFKVGFRLPLSALHRRLLRYLGLAITQIALSA